MRHGLDINDALRLGFHRQHRAAGFFREIELRQRLNQFQRRCRHGRRIVPKQPVKLHPISNGKARGQAFNFAPGAGLQRQMRWVIQEVAFKILEQIIDIIFIQPPHRRRRSFGAQLCDTGFDHSAFKRHHRVTVEILHEGVSHYLHDVCFGQHAADHGHAGQTSYRARGEARHKPGGFLAAIGVDVTIEAAEFLPKTDCGGLAFLPRQGGDQIAFPLLAWAKDGNAHRPACCIGKLARAQPVAPEIPRKGRAFLAHQIIRLRKPFNGALRSIGNRIAALGQGFVFGIRCCHDLFLTAPKARRYRASNLPRCVRFAGAGAQCRDVADRPQHPGFRLS